MTTVTVSMSKEIYWLIATGRQWQEAVPDTQMAAPAHTDLGHGVAAHQASMIMYDTVWNKHTHTHTHTHTNLRDQNIYAQNEFKPHLRPVLNKDFFWTLAGWRSWLPIIVVAVTKSRISATVKDSNTPIQFLIELTSLCSCYIVGGLSSTDDVTLQCRIAVVICSLC